MKSFKEITHWEVQRRIEALTDFRTKVVEWVNATRTDRTFGGRHDTDESSAMRPAINLVLHEVMNIIAAAGIPTTIYYREAPVAGGRELSIDLITNIFSLTTHQIPYDMATGMMERAIGIYQSELKAAKIRTFNPFWWLGKFISWFAHLPFKALRGAGFNTAKAEQSVIGKLVTLLTGAIPVITGLLSIITTLGLLDELKALLGLS